MFEDYFFDNPELQGLLDAIGYTMPAAEPIMNGGRMVYDGAPIMDEGYGLLDGGMMAPAAAPAAEQQPLPAVQPMTYEDREARRIAANTPPPGTSIVGPYAGKKGLSFGKDNTFDIYDEQEVRVVDGQGNVIFSGVGVEGAKRAVAVAQSLSDDLGKNANFKIQKGERTIVDGSVGPNRYIDVAYAAPSQSGLGFLADTVLPFAASFIPGVGPVIGAALGSAASSAVQGRDLEDALKRAALAGGTAYVGGQVFGPATSATPAPMTGINADLIPNALQGLSFAPLASAAVPAGVGGAVGDIIVNAATQAATSAVPSVLGSTLGNVLGQAGLSEITGYKTPAEQFVEQSVQEPVQPPAEAAVEPIVVSANRGVPPVSGSGSAFAAAVPVPIEAILSGVLAPAQPLPQQQPTTEEAIAEEPKEDIVVSAYRPINPVGGFDPTSVSKDLAGVGGSVLAALPALGNLPMDPALTARPEPEAVTQDTGLLGTALGALPALANLPADPSLTQPPSDNKFDFKDVLGTGLSLPELISIGGIGADLLKNLLAGGGGGATTPYVSPFGTGVGFGTGQDMRANPNIIDYERYGFGPEAMFFQPGYGLLSSAGSAPAPAPAPQAQPVMITNPRYEPLI